MNKSRICPFCGAFASAPRFVYNTPPAGETRFHALEGQRYHREFWACAQCGHFWAVHEIDLSRLYAEDYVSSTYGEEGLRTTYERIMALPPDRSDNYRRVQCVMEWTAPIRARAQGEGRQPEVLDVGSGLCVFLARMQETGWRGTGVEPDPRFAKHGRAVANATIVTEDFLHADHLGQYDLIAFNKVLEHVRDPIIMLARSRRFLREGGAVYVEVPDGPAAAQEGAGREEFFLEHYHAFSAASLCIMAQKARFRVQHLQAVHEPSTKYTLRALITPSEAISAQTRRA